MAKERGIWAEVLRGSRILWNKFFFFLIIGIILIGVGVGFHPIEKAKLAFKQFTVSADIQSASPTSGIGDQYSTEIDVAQSGTIKVDGKPSSDKVTPAGNYDELRYVITDGETKRLPKVIYNQLIATVKLPKPIEPSLLPANRRRLITAHGVGETLESRFTDSQTIVFEARNVVSSATVTVLIDFPQGYLTLGVLGEAQRVEQSVPGSVWLVMSIALPVVSLIIMFIIYSRTTGEGLSRPPKYMIDAPPDNLSPAAVGVLTHGRIRAKELLAVIIDLSNRDFLGVEDRDGELMVFKKNIHAEAWKTLRPFEATLIDELFGSKKTLNSAQEIKARESRDLFSRKVTKIYSQLYGDIVGLGLFEKNPVVAHWRYRIYGIVMFLLGIVGFLYAMVKSPDSKFTLFLWAAMMAIALLSIFIAARISSRTTRGRAELGRWLAFRNYLALGRPVNLDEAQEDEFERYLPYAIALDVELEWASRFATVDFRLPEWYGAAERILDIQGFANSFFPLLGHFTEQLSFMKEPVID